MMPLNRTERVRTEQRRLPGQKVDLLVSHGAFNAPSVKQPFSELYSQIVLFSCL